MAFLTVQGIAVPVADAGASRAQAAVGSRRRSGRGRMRDPRRATARDGLSLQTRPLLSSVADAFEGLLGSRGDVWLYTSGLESGRGLLPDPGARLIRFDPSGGSAFFPDFPGALTIDAGANGLILTHDPQLESDDVWTFAAWIDGAFQALTSTGQGYDSAGLPAAGILTPGGATGLFVDVIDGRLFMFLDDAAAHTIEAAILLPVIAPADWFTQWAPGGFLLGPAPILGVSGDARERSKVWAHGETLDQPFTTLAAAGSWDVASRSLSFRLRDVSPQYLRDARLPAGAVT